jgi:hypothetical protein
MPEEEFRLKEPEGYNLVAWRKLLMTSGEFGPKGQKGNSFGMWRRLLRTKGNSGLRIQGP